MSPIKPTYPGVYIEEVPSGNRAITGASTSIAVFIGLASYGKSGPSTGPDAGTELLNGEIVPTPTRIGSFSEYQSIFGPPHPNSELATSVRLFFLNGGSTCFIINIQDVSTRSHHTFTDAATNDILKFESLSRGAKGNLITVEIDTIDISKQTFTVKISYTTSGTSVEKERFFSCSMDPKAENFVVNELSQSQYVRCEVVGNATSLPTAGASLLAEGNDNIVPLAVLQPKYESAISALDLVDEFNLLVVTKHASMMTNDSIYLALLPNVSNYCKNRRAFLLIDPISYWTTVKDTKDNLAGVRSAVYTDYSAIYFPNLKVQEFDSILEKYVPKIVGPAAAIAGVIARTDTERGVWKAPAGNEAFIIGISGLVLNLTDNENGVLNPQAVNCIRAFPTGTVSWGARTVAGYDGGSTDWRYVPVRRTALFLEETLFRATKWAVFEPNDEPTWASIRASINAFMLGLFEDGAFQGDSPSKAFFVKCDTETTTEADRNNGILNVEIGFAPLKPAEFVIIKLQQIQQQT